MKKVYGFFKTQKTGIIIGFTVTGLLIIGSLIMNFLPKDYEELSGEDITFFFKNIKPINIWFYLMFVAFAMYGMSIFFCTLNSVIKKIRSRTRKIPLYGASIVHIGFMVTLAAHLIGGIGSDSGNPITVADTWVDTGDFEMKVADFKSTSYPNGMPKRIRAHMKIRRDGKEIDDTFGYNNPVLLDHGTKEILLRTYGNVPKLIALNIGGERKDLRIHDNININGSKVFLANLYLPPMVRLPVIKLVSEDENTKNNQIYIPIGRQNTQKINGEDITFVDIKTSPAVVVTVKENASIPLTLVALGCCGSVMLLVVISTAYKMIRV